MGIGTFITSGCWARRLSSERAEMLRNSVTLWIRAVESNDEAAAQALFDRYFARVQTLARRRLANISLRVVDEEDIAITTFQACLARVASGRFPPLQDRDELWRLLVKITERKVVDALRKHLSAKRGDGRVRGESVFLCQGGEDSTAGFSQIPDREAKESLGLQFADEYRKLMSLLEDEGLREVARMALAGCSTAEIAQQTNRTRRTVQRRLAMILEIWKEQHNQEVVERPNPKKAA